MKFVLHKDVTTKDGNSITWIEAGIYPVVRIFDRTRLLIDVGRENGKKQLTLVSREKGQLSKD